MCNANALRFKQFLVEERIASILKKEKVKFHSAFHPNTLSG
jgi:hypothetical protein